MSDSDHIQGPTYAELLRRVEMLEEWKAAQEAVSQIRRWFIPLTLSIVGGVAGVTNVLFHLVK